MSTPPPLDGFVRGTATNNGDKVRKALDHDVNTFTGQPHSEQYRALLSTRKKLPVHAQMDKFYYLFRDHQIIIVDGETNSGKTTQIPQFVAYSDLPHTKGRIVACTQPRRMATISAAKRVAEEMDVKLGAHVGYSIRFEDMTIPGTTFLKYMTDGILLREAINDPDLQKYSTIVLDEVHERTLATDILMVLLKTLVKKRSDLKIIIISAAIPTIFKVSGTNFPVKIFYTQEPEPDYVEAAIRTVLIIHRVEDPGDILLFLSGEEEIEETCQKLKLQAISMIKQDPSTVGPLLCIPLYSSLPPERQQQVYNPPPQPLTPDGPAGRKVIVATSIAEMSLTISGIVYVVDPGFSKCCIYNPRLRVESQLVSPISKKAAQQRAGRAGRTRPGKCFRLYTERDFILELEENTHPEILSSNLSSTVLQLVRLGIKDLVRFDYFDAPAPETLLRALELLNYLAALDDEGNLTALGAVMAEFPLEPQAILIVSPEYGCSNEILTVVAMLSVPPVWRRPMNERREADAAKALLTVPGSDHLTLLNVYNEYKANIADTTWAQSHYLSRHALSQADKARTQLAQIMERFKIDIVTRREQQQLYANIKQVLVCGFFMQVAHKSAGKDIYLTLKDNQVSRFYSATRFPAHYSPGQLAKKPEWVIFNEFILTEERYIRTVTEIKPEWLLKSEPTYFDLRSFPDCEAKRALQRISRRSQREDKELARRLRFMNL
ncbi:P-loop containing nucleoside triphosphate hydrolase protein [Mycena vulgaris]|nr:P-loop containing nucleoside triphosphate hydrolase protein [Mycena vulgaris]